VAKGITAETIFKAGDIDAKPMANNRRNDIFLESFMNSVWGRFSFRVDALRVLEKSCLVKLHE